MRNPNKSFILFLSLVMITIAAGAQKTPDLKIDLVNATATVTIVYSIESTKLDSIAAALLAKDIELVTNKLPKITTDLKGVSGNVIIIGQYDSKLIKSLNISYFNQLAGKWEVFGHKLLIHPFKNIAKALVIAGSDARGTAYGVFNISEQIGVSPWYWWADVKPEKKEKLTLAVSNYIANSPSVKFRGIFINDEDFGLQPWAAKTFEPETGDIGPKTYSKIFELLLRLKFNLIWPAMHPSTKPFYSYPGNNKVAADYQIVVGSSHAEPMLRNNVGEWDEKTMGRFNYVTNKDKVYRYWENRIKESSNNKVLFSIGMRGVHDSPIEGAKGNKEVIPLLEKVFADQRDLFEKHLGINANKVPQIFTPYKEVLDIYEGGLKVPEDVSLVWPDDNYGYIQRLSNAAESKRSGGSGIYYHNSYWGRPHDYLWISTMHPSLIREEMTKAYLMNARNFWILNVGDIKPGEYNMQLFADMAYHIEPFMESGYTKLHLQKWIAKTFGEDIVVELSNILWKHFDLAFERKPEFMGWSQTEPTTATKPTDYNHFAYGDQAQQRIDAYHQLEKQTLDLKKQIPAALQDAYFELVEYPVVGASLMNKKWLYHDKAIRYAAQGRLIAKEYATLTLAAYNEILAKTNYYNTQLVGGKWNKIMSMEPRKLPVFGMPKESITPVSVNQNWVVMPENHKDIGLQTNLSLPKFDQWNRQRYFIDLFLAKDTTLSLKMLPSANWIKLSSSSAMLSPNGLKAQERIWVEIDWETAPKQALKGSILITAGNRNMTVLVNANNSIVPTAINFKGKIAGEKYVVIPAADFTSSTKAGNKSWKIIDDLGSFGKSIEAWPLQFSPTFNSNDTISIGKHASVSYAFLMQEAAKTSIKIFALPTHPLNKAFELRCGVSIDGGPISIINFRTIGRSEEWKQNVLRNSAIKTIGEKDLNAGKHTITIYQIDPGLILDKLFVDLGGAPPFYGTVSGTK
jgi:hypothetical protein